MSMIGNLRRADDTEVARLLAHPDEIRRFLYGEPDHYEDRADIDLDKALHGIHFVLTGSEWGGEPPVNFLVSGGTEVGEVDVGYGPARAFTSAEVRHIDEALAPIAPEEFVRRINLSVLANAGIYPDVWDRESEADINIEYLSTNYATLRSYLETLARDGLGMLVYVN
jgi:hypothetical protein